MIAEMVDGGVNASSGTAAGNAGNNNNAVNGNKSGNNTGRQGHGKFNRNNNNNNSKKNNNTKKSTSDAKATKFEGHCEGLKGFIFDCSGPTQADRYVTTKREIEEYIGRTYKYGRCHGQCHQ